MDPARHAQCVRAVDRRRCERRRCKDGFNIGASGATLDGNTEGRSGEALFPLVKRNGQAEYDYKRLQDKLMEIKKSFTDEESMIISADGAVPYDVVIKVMDAARRTPDGRILFPGVAFAAGVVG